MGWFTLVRGEQWIRNFISLFSIDALKKAGVVIDVECRFIGVLRTVQKNPRTMYDDSKVINLD